MHRNQHNQPELHQDGEGGTVGTVSAAQQECPQVEDEQREHNGLLELVAEEHRNVANFVDEEDQKKSSGASSFSSSSSSSGGTRRMHQRARSFQPRAATNVGGLTDFSFVTCRACENPTLVLWVCSQAPFHTSRQQDLVEVVLNVTLQLWFSQHHRVSRFNQPADASLYPVLTQSSAHLELGAVLYVDDVLCLFLGS